MTPAPRFEPWPLRPAPRYSRWMIGGVVVLALVGCAGVLLRPFVERWLPLIGALALVLWLFALLVRVLLYRFNGHNAHCFETAAQQVDARWWARHRQQAALVQMVLVGPACSTPLHRPKLFVAEHKPSGVKGVDGRPALRVVQVLGKTPAVREQQLAETLVIQLKAQHPLPLPGAFTRCYWQGSPEAWSSFAREMSRRFDVDLPEQPEPWQGRNSLEQVIDLVQNAAEGARVLCAGVESCAAGDGAEVPGEAAVLWLLGREGGVRVTRGEWFAADTDQLACVGKRARQQAGLAQSTNSSVRFSGADDDLSELDWRFPLPAAQTNFGELKHLQGMVALSLAAAFAELNDEPCAWLASDPSCTLAMGVVKPDDSTP